MAGKILDNGTLVTLGLVGVVAAAGAVVKRGSAARVSEADIRAAVARAKREIEADQKAGVVPRTVRSFAELHDHVDANAYGGFTDPDGPFHDLSSEALVRAANTVQAEIDAWLRRA